MYLGAAVDTMVKKVLKPLELEGRWILFRVEQFLPTSLRDTQLKQSLEREIGFFEQWLAEKSQKNGHQASGDLIVDDLTRLSVG